MCSKSTTKHVFAAAVCDFCKKRESELYQKEVGKLISYPVVFFVFFFTNSEMFEISKTPPNLSCDFSYDEDLSPEHAGGAFLPPVDSVPALSGFPPRGCALHKVKERRTAFGHPHPSTPHSRCVTLSVTPTVGTVPSST